jgi:hypothetical protein
VCVCLVGLLMWFFLRLLRGLVEWVSGGVGMVIVRRLSVRVRGKEWE